MAIDFLRFCGGYSLPLNLTVLSATGVFCFTAVNIGLICCFKIPINLSLFIRSSGKVLISKATALNISLKLLSPILAPLPTLYFVVNLKLIPSFHPIKINLRGLIPESDKCHKFHHCTKSSLLH